MQARTELAELGAGLGICCIQRNTPELEKSRAQLTKGICCKGSESETQLMIFRKLGFIFVLLDGHQSASLQNMAAGKGMTQSKIKDTVGMGAG